MCWGKIVNPFENLSSKENVKTFIDKLLYNANIGYVGEYDEVGEYLFIDINNDGVDELIATLDASGRKFFDSIIIVFKEENKFKYQEIWSRRSGDSNHLSKEVIDVNNDGVKELLVMEEILPYPKYVLWTSVYELQNNKYVKADEKYSDFYKNKIIPELESKIKDMQNKNLFIEKNLNKSFLYYSYYFDIPKDAIVDATLRKNSRELTTKEKEVILSYFYLPLYKAYRVTKKDRKAGFDKAIQWSKSAFRELRRNAISVFEEFNNDESIKYLEILKQDKDNYVSGDAESTLERVKKQRRP